jgi:threonine aldolase
MPPVIDLRSDTVTRPSAAMRAAIAGAAVGDDVYGEDPTINALQEQVAALLGCEAALFVPSGSMANQIAIAVHTRPGDEIIAGNGAHSWLYESGGAAAIAGVQVRLAPGDGRFDAAGLRSVINPADDHFARTRLVTIENTHNNGGGVAWRREAIDEVLGAAREAGLATHLDGARLWNAAAALGVAEAELAAGFDTVSVCLSKGLGAPVGSLVAGSKDRIHEAHRIRKRLGGGMRQAGLLAAAGLHALEHNRPRLVEDHANARLLAEALGATDNLSVDLDRVETNIIMVDIEPVADFNAPELAQRARERGVLFGIIHGRRFRLVTHLDVDADACRRAAAVIAELAAA